MRSEAHLDGSNPIWETQETQCWALVSSIGEARHTTVVMAWHCTSGHCQGKRMSEQNKSEEKNLHNLQVFACTNAMLLVSVAMTTDQDAPCEPKQLIKNWSIHPSSAWLNHATAT